MLDDTGVSVCDDGVSSDRRFLADTHLSKGNQYDETFVYSRRISNRSLVGWLKCSSRGNR